METTSTSEHMLQMNGQQLQEHSADTRVTRLKSRVHHRKTVGVVSASELRTL